MSTRAKGDAWEIRVRKYLESLGFTVERAWAWARFNPAIKRLLAGRRDFFGAADLIAVHPEREFTLLVQCQDAKDQMVGRKKEAMEAVPWNLRAQRPTIWFKEDGIRGGVRVLRLATSGEPSNAKAWGEFLWRMVDGEAPVGGLLG